ncbi:MAG: adenylate/guanylate cyclase domain-containing protein [Pseudomonadota bacterium]
MQRRLAAILAADVVGYTRMMSADEAGTLSRLTDLRKEVIEPIIAEHRGRIVKLIGDGLLVEFASVVDAIACGRAWQEAVSEHERARDEEHCLCFRIGINMGDIIVEDGDIHGDGVNIAARLEGLADPGAVCLSSSAWDQAKGKVDVAIEDLGEKRLKNVPDPVRVYRLQRDYISRTRTGDAREKLSLPDKPSIAVLPFDNMSSDLDQEYFSDGITEDIITELSRFPTLFVIARNSTFSYKGKPINVKQVAWDLGVRYVLEGSVRRAGQRVRITAQLIDSQSGNHLWAERYDRDLEDIFALQEEITRHVVGSIAPQIEMAELARANSASANEVSAYDLSLKALALFYEAVRRGKPEVYQCSLETAASALEKDANCTSALWLQAWANFEGFLLRWEPDAGTMLDRAEEAAERLVDISPSDPRGYSVRGVVRLCRDAHEDAVADCRYAFSLNPNFAINIFFMAWCESLSGYTQAARDHAALGLRLSPRDSELWLGVAYLALAQACFGDGDFSETQKWARLAVQMHPKAPIRRALMIACCMHNQDLEAAKNHTVQLRSFAPGFIQSIISGDLTLYKDSSVNRLLADGLARAVALLSEK